MKSRSSTSAQRSWRDLVAPYKNSALCRSVWQLLNTLLPYALLWGLMAWCATISFWLVLPLSVLAAGFLVRTFIIFHDCTHGSFFQSQRANDFWGFVTGVLTFTPYHMWRYEHSVHHATSGDLDRRGLGDIWTLTVQEYLESSRWKRLAYRLARNPVALFVIAPAFLFLVKHRVPPLSARKRERMSVYWTNLAIAIVAVALSYGIGWKAYLLIQLPVVIIAATAGVWLFYVQHQFEGVYWERREEWDFQTAALKGSSFYKLPKVLQWFTGSIGFHHIHHLSPSIPNYRLEKCHKENTALQQVNTVTILSSFKSFQFRLWDEQNGKLVGYRHLKSLRRAQAKAART